MSDPEVIEVKAVSKQLVSIPVQADSLQLAPQNHTQLVAFIRQMIEAGAMPKHLTNVPQIISAWNFAAQLRLPPQPSLRNIAVIEGTPQMFGDLPLALVQRHKEFVHYSEYNFDRQYNKICFENKNLDAEIYGGLVYIQRKGMEKPESFTFTVDDAKRAGIGKLITKNGNATVYAKYPQVMYIRRARIMSIRAHFADALAGACIAEEFGYAPDLIDVTPIEGDNSADDLTAEINNLE